MIHDGATGKHIGIIHFKTGDTDGVSLEIDKWTRVFQQEGHTVFLCSGRHGRNRQNDTTDDNAVVVTIIDELDYHTDEAMRMNRETFDRVSDETSYRAELLRQTDRLQGKLIAWIRDNRLDVVIPQNIWSVGLHPAAAIALAHAVEHTSVRVLAQHHDFYWERINGIRLSCPTAIELTDTYLPPHNSSYTHVVINSLAKEALAIRKGIDAAVIPNVLDYAGPDWEIDAWNTDFRDAFDLAPSDIVVLQATRIVPRKGIELAIDVVAALQRRKESLIGRRLSNGKIFSASNRIVLVLAGYAQDDDSGTYLKRLQQKADMKNVMMISIGDRITSTRTIRESEKAYALWDAYVHADLITYPSYWEGWGNQLLEAVKARLPIVLFEYPVYGKDIAPSGFSVISLGKTIDSWSEDHLAHIKDETIEEAVDEVLAVLLDRQRKENMVESNYRIAQQYYSIESLASYLKPLMSDWS
ncbi:MAG: glycosyltransferase family 4 protein [Sphaerochaetaceae bacterium]|jgi:glycosyltransferase involved in cell wall biosynthesis|nr:glycosyltransferase family 4 protein [Sphaerochaetaceae bacterium]MDX9810696.1 glycosyltransferase family 4 protein [Sphaerochaetaceae bacterium]